ncbi:MAG: hypothetical protein J7K58_03870 [Euryarchaeota archaeon]|nr:hypothetical protein [Euryarchaeota archaeon]
MRRPYSHARTLAMLTAFILILGVLSELSGLLATSVSKETIGHVTCVTINYEEGKLENISVSNVLVIEEIAPAEFGEYSGKNFDGTFWTFATTKFSIKFRDSNPTDVMITLSPKMDVKFKFHNLKTAYIINNTAHVEGDYYIIDMRLVGAKEASIVESTTIEVKGNPLFSLIIYMKIYVSKSSAPTYFDDIKYLITNGTIENVTVNNKTIINKIIIGNISESRVEEYIHVIKGEYGIVEFNDPKGKGAWFIWIYSLGNLTLLLNGSLTELYGPYKFFLYRLNNELTVKVYGDHFVKDSTLVLSNGTSMLITNVKIPGLTRISTLENISLWKCKCVAFKGNIIHIEYGGKTVFEDMFLGEYIDGFKSDKSAYMIFEHGSLMISWGAITIYGEKLSMKVPNAKYISSKLIIPNEGASIIIRVEGNWSFNSTIGELKIVSGVLNAFLEINTSRVLSNGIITINIAENGISSIKVVNLDIMGLSVNAGDFIGFWGNKDKIIFWKNASARILFGEDYVRMSFNVGDIAIHVSHNITIKEVSNGLVLLQYNNKTYSIIMAENMRILQETIEAQGHAVFVIGPQIDERLISLGKRGYNEEIGFTSYGRFRGRYVSFNLTGDQIMDYSVFGVKIMRLVALSELARSGLTVQRNGAFIVINTSMSTLRVFDTMIGLMEVKSREPMTLYIILPDELLFFKGINNSTLSYMVQGLSVRVEIVNGSLTIRGTHIIVEMAQNSTLRVFCEPLYDIVPGALVKVMREHNLVVSMASLLHDTRFTVEISADNAVRIHSEGEGAIIDVELDPSLGVTFDDLSNISVNIDGVEMTSGSLLDVIKNGYYAFYFDGVSLHLIIEASVGSHTISVKVPVYLIENVSQNQSEGPTQSQTPTGTSTSTEDILSSETSRRNTIIAVILIVLIISIMALAYGRHKHQ